MLTLILPLRLTLMLTLMLMLTLILPLMLTPPPHVPFLRGKAEWWRAPWRRRYRPSRPAEPPEGPGATTKP